MRTVRFSKTALDQFNALLAQGIEPFGARVVAEKRDRVYATIEHILAAFPAIKRRHAELGLCVYPIARTPFMVLYDFDDVELRVHFVFHRHADLRDLDPRAAEW
jgi:plasmid stabilization system protein ParE